jgi:hypothetical protein
LIARRDVYDCAPLQLGPFLAFWNGSVPESKLFWNKWPLGFDHINMLGRYPFILSDLVAHEEL